MKQSLPAIFFFLVINYCLLQNAKAQNRRVSFKAFGKDSVNLFMDAAYNMIEDSCASIIRYAHVDYTNKHFIGQFTDVSKQNPKIILDEGVYNPDGLKNGGFVIRYTNGNMQAKGAYKNDKYIGKWELFYEDGSPRVIFIVDDGITDIVDAWDKKNIQTVTNGNGHFKAYNPTMDIIWYGKITNGRPDSTWNFADPDAPKGDFQISENFKKGRFVKGKSPVGSYDDASHIVLIADLPINNAQRFAVAPYGCNAPGVNGARIISNPHQYENAHYFNGTEAFSQKIKEVLANLGTVRVAGTNARLSVTAVVDEKGNIGNFVSDDNFEEKLSMRLISCLERLPELLPATIDKKPVKQRFRITLIFNNYSYSFSYQFLAIKLADAE